MYTSASGVNRQAHAASSATTCTAASVMSSSPCVWRTTRVAARATRELAAPAGNVKLYASESGDGGGVSAAPVERGQAETATDAIMTNSLVRHQT